MPITNPNLPWFNTNVPKYMTLGDYQVPKDDRRDGDAIPAMKNAFHFDNHQVKGFIRGREYFDSLLEETNRLIAAPNNAFFYIHGWCFQLFQHEALFKFWGQGELPQALQELEVGADWEVYHKGNDMHIGNSQTFVATQLQRMEDAGVDVRVMGWISPPMLKYYFANQLSGQIGRQSINGRSVNTAQQFLSRLLCTFYSILQLRENYLTLTQVIMNTLAHPLGGAHAKFFIAGNQNCIRAYTGGIDVMPSRAEIRWQDAAVSVEGNAAIKMAQFFKQLWNENTSRSPIQIRSEIRDIQSNTVIFPDQEYRSHYGTILDFDKNAVNAVETPTTANKRVQMYRTCPRMNYAKIAPYKRWGALYAVGSGNATKKVWKALVNAESLANVPHLWTPALSFAPKGIFEFKVVVRKAIAGAEKYIFIMDQEAINTQLFGWINIELKKQSKTQLKVIVLTSFRTIIEKGSCHIKDPIMIKAFREYLAKGLSENLQNEKVFWGRCSTHAKVILIDDTWISIGSANCQKRSFYTDIEMGTVVVHDAWVKEYRQRLWRFLCRPNVNDVPDNIDQALNIWDSSWGTNQNTAQLNPSKARRAYLKLEGYYDPYSSIKHQRQDPDSNDAI